MNRRKFIQIFNGTIASASVVPYIAKSIVVKKKIPTLKDMRLHRFEILDKMNMRAMQEIQKEEDIRIFKDICKEYGISKRYLEQIFSSLKQARYIKTKTGASGGYKLAKPAKKISVAEIIRLMDGALAPTLAVSKYFFEHTPLEKEKKVTKFFKTIRDYTSDKVERLMISDLV